jgi:hypothetical protein
MTEWTVSRCDWRVIGLAGALLVAHGCHWQPQESFYPVRGRITLDGQPLPRGSVTLRPEDNATGHQPTGMIPSPGEYVVYTNRKLGAPLGKYKVTVFATEAATDPSGAPHPGLPKSLVSTRYNSPHDTPLRLEVVAQPAAHAYDLELKNP